MGGGDASKEYCRGFRRLRHALAMLFCIPQSQSAQRHAAVLEGDTASRRFSCEVEEQELRAARMRGDRDLRLVLDRDAVAGCRRIAVDLDGAAHALNPAAAASAQFMRYR